MFQKIQLQIGIVAACPKSLDPIYGTHSPLGIKEHYISLIYICKCNDEDYCFIHIYHVAIY
jgi:hypothetical protein